MDDTPETVKEMYRDMLMARTPSERARMGSDMHAAAKQIVLSSLPKGLSAGERMRQLFLRFYENDFDAATAKKIGDRIAQAAEERAADAAGGEDTTVEP
jgi:hypothetical protein